MNISKTILVVVLTFSLTMVGRSEAQLTITEGANNQATFSGSMGGLSPFVCDNIGIPDNTVGFSAFTTTLDDILVVDAALTVTQGSFHNVANSIFPDVFSDTNPPRLGPLTDIFCAPDDTWVTTPAFSTEAAGTNKLDADGTFIVHFDTRDDGPVTDFEFARILLVPDPAGNLEFTFRGVVQTIADPIPTWNEFSYSYSVPEPDSFALLLVAALAGCGAVRRSRRS